MSEDHTSVEVFCSYAHEDEAWLRKLETHLSSLKREGLISLWYDRLIDPGTDWAQAIDTHLESASIILLLVSADFVASDYCYGIELQRAIARQEAGEARVIPILVRETDWHRTPFARFQALPTDAHPLATWLNEDTALANVAAGLRRVIEELPLLAASVLRATLPPIWNIPYPHNRFFLGRDEILTQLHRQLQADRVTGLSQPQAISGLGGIGKTQLAIEYAYQFARDYQAVLWARAESREALVSSYVTIATLLRLPEREAKEQDITVQAVKTWLQTYRNWLLILDNADSPAFLTEFLPPSVQGHLLLTTRTRALGQLASRIDVDILDPDTGALLLLRRAGLLTLDVPLEQAAKADRRLALQLCQELDGLPLALDQAGAYLQETECSLQQYLDLYHSHRTDLLRYRGNLILDHPETVVTTWSLSFTAVAERSAVAADVLQLCAVLHPDAIPEELFLQGAALLGPTLTTLENNSLALNSTLAMIQSYSLLRRNSHERTLSLHHLVQAVLHDTMTKEERDRWTERAIAALDAVFPRVTYEVWGQCERLLPQVLTCAATVYPGERSVELASLLAKTADYLRKRARYEQAEPLYQRALHICELARGPAHPEVARILEGLAGLYRKKGEYARTEPLYQRALDIRTQAQGRKHPDLAFALSNLADLYLEQGKYDKAEPLYQQALNIRERALGPEHRYVAGTLNGLADLYRKQGKYAQAEPLYQQALHIWERLGPEHRDVAFALTGLADLYRKQGKYAQAEPLYQQALRIRTQRLGSQHPATAEIIHNVAQLRDAQGNREEAKALYEQALAIREQALGDNHPKTKETRKCYIALLQAMGQHEKAALLEAAHSEREKREEE